MMGLIRVVDTGRLQLPSMERRPEHHH